jgi:hypothetical protein
MTPLPDALDLTAARSLVSKIRNGTLFAKPLETANEAWDLVGYGLSYLPEGSEKPIFGSALDGPILTDNEAADALEELADGGSKFQGPITSVIVAKLAMWALQLILGRIVGH